MLHQAEHHIIIFPIPIEVMSNVSIVVWTCIFCTLATRGGNVPCCSSPPQGDGNVAMPGPPAGAVVEDVLGLEDAVLMIAPWRPGKKTELLMGRQIVDMFNKIVYTDTTVCI